MNTLSKYVVAILIIFFIIITVYEFYTTKKNEAFTEKENIESEYHEISLDPGIQLGNYLSCYFYNMGLTFLRGHHFKTTANKNPKVFTCHFPELIEFDPSIQAQFKSLGITESSLHHELNQIDGHCVSAWSTLTKEREQFWKVLKPVINKIIDDALKASNLNREIDAPVIHYRCSDVPIGRESYYHFQRYEYFKNALEIITQKTNKTYNKVYICYCNTHNNNEKNQKACDTYSEELVNYLKSIGYEAIFKCSTINDDFATMFYAPGLISTSGSFSFMAGYFSNNVFVSTMYDENKQRECKDCEDWLLPGYTAKHSEIPDYFDTQGTIQILKR